MHKKILFTDLDGTLLNDEKKVSKELFTTLHQIQSAGHILVLSSGRPLDSIREVKEQLQLADHNLYISAYNGGLVYDCHSKQPVFEKRISFSDLSYILAMAKKTNTYCHTYTATHIVAEMQSPELSFYQKSIHLPAIIDSNILNALSEEPFKVLAVDLADHEHLKAFQTTLLPWSKDRITTLFSNPSYLELFPADSGKGPALAALCEHLQIPLTHAMAAGDMENDISMLEVAGYSIAMKNGSPLVKEVALVTTENDNNHDGLLPYIKSFFQFT